MLYNSVMEKEAKLNKRINETVHNVTNDLLDVLSENEMYNMYTALTFEQIITTASLLTLHELSDTLRGINSKFKRSYKINQ